MSDRSPDPSSHAASEPFDSSVENGSASKAGPHGESRRDRERRAFSHAAQGVAQSVEHVVTGVGGAVGGAVGGVVGGVFGAARGTIRLGLDVPRKVLRRGAGATPGVRPEELEQLAPAHDAPEHPIRLECIDYGPDVQTTHQFDDPNHARAFLEKPRPEGADVRWIDLNGVHHPQMIRLLAERHQLHPLAVEDVLDGSQRPKVELYRDDTGGSHWLFVVVRMMIIRDGALDTEQLACFVTSDTIITFQQKPGDVFDPVRQRIARDGSRLRQRDAGYLLYALLDTIVDHHFPILEAFSEQLEKIEDQVESDFHRDAIRRIHAIRRQLLLIRRQVWPIREILNDLLREQYDVMQGDTRVYLRDVYDHAVVIIDLVETYRELASGVADTYMSALSNHMSQVMKVLTIVASLFIPLSFLAGVFGMNFEHMPGMSHPAAFYLFCATCLSLVGGMLFWLRYKHWL